MRDGEQLSFHDLLVRWTFGETKARKISWQAWEMLECSVKFAKILFPKARLVICANNLSPSVQATLSGISTMNEVELLDTTDCLKENLQNDKVKNSWWKYAPPRLDSSKYEIILDNDVILWKMPPTLLSSIREGALVALSDAAGRYYGDFFNEVDAYDQGLCLNAGLIGMPPGFSMDFNALDNIQLTDFFHSEQGFTALNFARYKGGKNLISLKEVAQLNTMDIEPQLLLSEYSGGHFCGCSFAHYSFWEKKYRDPIKQKLTS